MTTRSDCVEVKFQNVDPVRPELFPGLVITELRIISA